MKQFYLLLLAISLVMLLAIPWPCRAGILLLWPTVPDKPVIDLKVVDSKTGLISVREMTEEESLKEAIYYAYKDNFTFFQESLKDVMTGKPEQVISSKGPVWSKNGISYSIAYIADPKRIKCKIKPSGTCEVIDTGKMGGAEWLRANGYAAGKSALEPIK